MGYSPGSEEFQQTRMSKAKQKKTAVDCSDWGDTHTFREKQLFRKGNTCVCLRPDQEAGDIQKQTKVEGRYFGFRMESGNLC